MTRNSLIRLSSVGYRLLKRLGFEPSSDFYYRARRKALARGIWAETKLALLDEIISQKRGGQSVFARRLLDAVSRLPETPAVFTQVLFVDGAITKGDETQSSDPELSRAQNEALSKSLCNSVTFLMGAPGSGKTRVISKVVLQLLEQGESVLFCCNTRAALNHATNYLGSGNLDLTLSTVTGLINEVSLPQFDTIVVDEAGMASLAEVLVLSDLAAKRMIFVGDPMQLPPIATTQSHWLSQNVFHHQANSEELSDLYVWQRREDSFAVLLKEQFEIPERLFNVLNHFCYGGRLSNQSTGKGHITFIDSSGLCTTNTGKRSSPTNTVHADLVVETLNSVLKKKTVQPENVGVISPFKDQVSLLEKKAKEAGMPSGIEFGTAYTFQGRLKNCLILDTTVTGADYAYPSLADDNQARALMNSALSRCRTVNDTEGRLIVIADMDHIRQQYPDSVALQFLYRLFFRADVLDAEEIQKYSQTTSTLVSLFLKEWTEIDSALGSGDYPTDEKIKTLIYNACDLIPRLINLCNRIRPKSFVIGSALNALEKPHAALALANLSDAAQFNPERLIRFESVITDLYKIIYESTMIAVPGEHRNRGPDKPIYDPDADGGQSYGRVRIWTRELRNYQQHDHEKPEDYRKDFSKRQRNFVFEQAIGRPAPEEQQISRNGSEDYSGIEYLRVTLFLLKEVVTYLDTVRNRL